MECSCEIIEDGKLKRKSFSWHYSDGRTHDEALNLANEFLKQMEK